MGMKKHLFLFAWWWLGLFFSESERHSFCINVHVGAAFCVNSHQILQYIASLNVLRRKTRGKKEAAVVEQHPGNTHNTLLMTHTNCAPVAHKAPLALWITGLKATSTAMLFNAIITIAFFVLLPWYLLAGTSYRAVYLHADVQTAHYWKACSHMWTLTVCVPGKQILKETLFLA